MRTQNRWVAKRTVFKNVLKKGNGTKFVLEPVEFNTHIQEYIFLKA